MIRSLGRNNRYVWIGLIGLVLICLLVIIFAPSNGVKTSGSTYSRTPEGYLGWYTYMEAQGTPVQRWQRPTEELLANQEERPQTLVRIYADLVSLDLVLAPDWVDDWLESGNRLVLLGIRRGVTEADFNSQQESPHGDVAIATRRRETDMRGPRFMVLGDNYGAVVWQESPDQADPNQADPDQSTPDQSTPDQSTPDQATPKGSIILASTQHLAANAYQSNNTTHAGNYAFLAELLTQSTGPIWVDEYLHGYKDTDVILEDAIGNWSDYLAKTPVAVVVIQLGLMIGVFILAQNRRLGTRAVIKTPVVDNSQAYIEALAAVLHKAGSSAFVIDEIAKAERLKLQKALGLGKTTVEDKVLKQAWIQQTGQTAQLLTPLLKPPPARKSTTDRLLQQWLMKLQQIQQQVNLGDLSPHSTPSKTS